ncbi:MAG TPA: galactokinase family protein [Clostridia bacterium]|nr:galactokinase family protein [Clostridia bacterium]
MDKLFAGLYGQDAEIISYQKKRYSEIFHRFNELFPDSAGHVQFFSTPGRTEVGGNHTDHNHGRVLAAGVTMDSVAAAAKTEDSLITLYSHGYDGVFQVDTHDLVARDDERETTHALIRGIATRFKELGLRVGGFNAYVSSDVLRGSGLSSSASIEVLIGTILSHLYNDGQVDVKLLAIIGQYAENVFFGKPCGLMDQMACAVGGFVTMDFKDPNDPKVEKIDFDFHSKGYSLLVVDTGGSHADLTEDYASIPIEMKAIAEALGAEVCRELTMKQVIDNIPMLRERVNDRAILRAMHFIKENNRVTKQVRALEEDDFTKFLSLIKESGNSSWKWLQNCYSAHAPLEQGVTLALALTEDFIGEIGKGACRVHGGGFAGTIQVFIPTGSVKGYIEEMEPIFGEGSVTVLGIRPLGTTRVNIDIAKIYRLGKI